MESGNLDNFEELERATKNLLTAIEAFKKFENKHSSQLVKEASKAVENAGLATRKELTEFEKNFSSLRSKK